MKILCWTIVIAGWLLYGLVLLAEMLHPTKSDPIEDFQRFFTQETWEHWQFNLVALTLVGLWLSAWAYLQDNKKPKDKNEKT